MLLRPLDNGAMIDIGSLTTFSGLMAFAATLAVFSRRRLLAGTLLVMAGTAGIAIVWDRWSLRTGDHFDITALLSPSQLNAEDTQMLITHIPLLIIGVVLLALTGSCFRDRDSRSGSRKLNPPAGLLSDRKGYAGQAQASMCEETEPEVTS